jgi:hypothetical protein
MHSPTKARANVIKLQSIKNVIQRVSHIVENNPTGSTFSECYYQRFETQSNGY